MALTPAERTAFAHLWSLADPSQSGVFSGDQAVSFFAGSHLSPAVLGQIWAISDSDNVGFLSPSSFGTALRLISHAQQGHPVSPALASTPTIPPVLDGISYPQPQAPPSRSASVLAASPSASQAPLSPTDTISAADRSRFARIFAQAGPIGGLLDGGKAKDVFLKSKLPIETLGQIWALADTRSRGALDLIDFTIAMHFIQAIMKGAIASLPTTLPPGLYEQLSGGQSLPLRSFTPSQPVSRVYTPAQGQHSQSRQSSVYAPAAPITPQGTGAVPSRSSTGFQDLSAQPAALSSGASVWDISPAELANANKFFDSLDGDKTGQIPGPLAVPFFLQSKLDETTLARVWYVSE